MSTRLSITSWPPTDHVDGFASGWPSCRSTASLTLRASASRSRHRSGGTDLQGGHRKVVMALVAVAGVAPPAASAPDDHRHIGKPFCVLVLKNAFPSSDQLAPLRMSMF